MNLNPKPHKNFGNKGGGRLGYTYEKDQLVKLRRMVDWMLGYMDAIRKGKVSDKGLEIFKTLLPPMMKALDKLHPNKQQVNLGLGEQGEGQNNLSELTIFFRAVAQPKEIDEGTRQPSLPDSSQIIQE